MENVSEKLLAAETLSDDEMCRRLIPLMVRPTGVSTAGFPYFSRRTFESFRDTVPYLFAAGEAVLSAQEKIVSMARELSLEEEARLNIERSCRVAAQMAKTAAITAPTDLWLLRHILGVHAEFGLLGRLLDGEAIHPEFCEVDVNGARRTLDAEQLSIDLNFLLARGLVEQYDETFRIAGHRRVRELFERIGPIADDEPVPVTPLWRMAFSGETLSDDVAQTLARLKSQTPSRRTDFDQNHWIPTVEEVITGYLLVPVVLGLRAAELSGKWRQGDVISTDELSCAEEVATTALGILESAGWVNKVGTAGYEVSALGERGLLRGPGPFGIIQTYVSYMKQGAEILLQGRRKVWVRRGENIGASQDANRRTFEKANDALDRFCEETGFSFDVFIEHAIGRGEATRQRFERDGEEAIRYFGADLEDPAIDAAEAEQRAGRLPQNMIFVRRADIGKPEILTEALTAAGVETEGAVMLVGNGFHEVRDQVDEKMVEVFKGYHEAGILLLFTEENALSVDDLRATAWNTYHAGFKYVHEKSGQCLRPASPRPKPRLGPPLRAAWSECASQAGYVRLEKYCGRTRTIYPYPRPDGQNPSISVNHFFVPRQIAEKLGLC